MGCPCDDFECEIIETTTQSETTTAEYFTTPALPPTPPPNVSGWGEWAEWSSCTVSCDVGQRSRMRICSDGNGGTGDENDCPGEGVIAEECNEGKCLTGGDMVEDTSQDLRRDFKIII